MPPPCWRGAVRRTRGGSLAGTPGSMAQRCRDALSCVLNTEDRLYATADIGRTAESHGTCPALWCQYGSRGDPPPGSDVRPWHDGPVRPPGIGWAGAVDARGHGHGGGYVQSGPQSDRRWPVCRPRLAPRRCRPRAGCVRAQSHAQPGNARPAAGRRASSSRESGTSRGERVSRVAGRKCRGVVARRARHASSQRHAERHVLCLFSCTAPFGHCGPRAFLAL